MKKLEIKKMKYFVAMTFILAFASISLGHTPKVLKNKISKEYSTTNGSINNLKSYFLPPKTITITDISSKGRFTITGILDGNKYKAKHPNGTYSEFEIIQFDQKRVHLIRRDLSGPTKGMGGEYKGKITGKESAEGTTIITWKNWNKPLDVRWIISW